MLGLAKFPHLQTLNLSVDAQYVGGPGQWYILQHLCAGIGPKLRALIICTRRDLSRGIPPESRGAARPFLEHLHYFTQLRVLVLDDVVDGDTLWQLKHLEFLHCDLFTLSHDSITKLMCAVRTLSVDCSLRKVSLTYAPETDPKMDFLQLYVSLLWEGLRIDVASTNLPTIFLPTSFTTTTKPAQLSRFIITGLSFLTDHFEEAVLHMPALESFDFTWQPHEQKPWKPQHSMPEHLEELTLRLNVIQGRQEIEVPEPFLPPCATLTSLSLISTQGQWRPKQLPVQRMVILIARNFPNMRELAIKRWEPTMNGAAAAYPWATEPVASGLEDDLSGLLMPLSTCQKLESLSLQFCCKEILFQVALTTGTAAPVLAYSGSNAVQLFSRHLPSSTGVVHHDRLAPCSAHAPRDHQSRVLQTSWKALVA